MLVNKEITSKVSIKDSYMFYKRNNEDTVDKKTYLLLSSLYNKFLIGKVLQGEKVTLPARFGTLCVRGKKQKLTIGEDGRIKGGAVDWNKTNKLWDENPEMKEKKKLVFYTNTHSLGIRYKYIWSKLNVMISNKTLYSLKMTRENKKLVSSLIKEGREFANY